MVLVSKRLLIVDDQPGLARVMQRVAEREGWEVVALTVSSEAVDAFLTFRPDVVILDMVMPGKDGIDVLHELLLTGIPARFVLISGFGNAFLRMGEGVAVFHGVEPVSILKKPFRGAEFVASLEAATRLPLAVV
jgi:two-component system, OmpR family, response regulator MtrA